MSDDAELLERIRNGATEDFAELVRRHQSRVFAILHRYERDTHKVEDLAQEAFVKAWRALGQFDSRAPFEHWLSSITTRVALDHLRREKRRQNEIGLPELGDDVLEWLRSGDEKSELDARSAAELLELAMRELSPADRVVITMQELEGRSVKEIAVAIGASGVAVRVRALRARSVIPSYFASLPAKSSALTSPSFSISSTSNKPCQSWKASLWNCRTVPRPC